jgi:hypothetical protein
VWLLFLAQSDDISLTAWRSSGTVAEQTLPSGSTVSFEGTAVGSENTAPVDTNAVQWSTNPYSWSSGAHEPATGVLTVDVSSNGTELDVHGLSTPIALSQTIPATTNLTAFRCSSWDSDKGDWSSDGLMVLGFMQVGSKVVAVCGTTHLSDFSGVASPSFIKVAPIGSIGDAGELAKVLDPSNLLTFIIVVVLVGVFFAAWIYSSTHDRKNVIELARLHQLQMRMFGEVQNGLCMDVVHLEKDHPLKLAAVRTYESLKVCSAVLCCA